jgi:hypothetical protein
MKKPFLFLILPLFLSFSSKAQNIFIDSTKNELGITINPFMNALGITSSDEFMTLQFKHHFSNASLRLGVSGIGSGTYGDPGFRNYIYKTTDSSSLINHYYNEKNTVRVNLGFEIQQMLRNNWRFYYGMDAIGGFSNDANRNEQTLFKIQTDSSFKAVSVNDTIINSRKFIIAGFAFVGGFDYFFSKRISAGIEGYFPITYEFQTGNIKNKSGSINFDQKFSILIKMHF